MSKESIRFDRVFRKEFEAIDSSQIKLRLKMKRVSKTAVTGPVEITQTLEEPCEEFEVDFLDLQYLAKDLNNL